MEISAAKVQQRGLLKNGIQLRNLLRERLSACRRSAARRNAPARRMAVGGAMAFALLVAVAACATMDAEAARRTTHTDFVKQNYERLLALQRRGPQPHAVDVMPQIQNIRPSENVIPHQTVLHRCDMLACCGVKDLSHFHCVPTVEDVKLYFSALDVRTRKQRHVVHVFQNHTQCDCVDKVDGL